MKEMTQEHKESPKLNRLYKDRIFRMIFSEKEELLSRYNAMNGTHYTNPDELVITTLDSTFLHLNTGL